MTCRAADSESAILAILLRHPETLDQCSLLGEDFQDQSHRTIFDSIYRLWHQGSPITPTSVSDDLERRSRLSSIGGPTSIQRLWDQPAAPENLRYYYSQVGTRGLQVRLQDSLRELWDPQQLQELLKAAHERSVGLTSNEAGVGLSEAVQQLDILNSPATEPALLSPFWSAQEGDQILIAGLRATGKSTIAADIALASCIPEFEGKALQGVLQWDLARLDGRKIAIIDGENSPYRWETLLRRLLEHRGIDPELCRELIKERFIYLHVRDLGLREKAHWESRSQEVANLLGELGVGFCVMDSAGRVWGASNLNDTDWVQGGLAPYAEGCKCQANPIAGGILAHVRRPTKNEPRAVGPLGSSTQENYVDGLLIVEPSGDGIRIRHEKSRRPWWIKQGTSVQIDWPAGKIGFEPVGDWATVWPDSPPTESEASHARMTTQVLAIVRAGAPRTVSTKDIAASLSIGERQVRRHLERLEAAGELKRGHGYAVIEDAGPSDRPNAERIGARPDSPEDPTDNPAPTCEDTDSPDSGVRDPMSESVNDRLTKD